MYRKQFLLTKHIKEYKFLKNVRLIGEYFLFLGNDSEYFFIKKTKKEIHLIGSMFSWRNPGLKNEDIITEIFEKANNIEEVINLSNHHCGEFVLIIRFDDNIYIFNDAASQKEVYYDNKFTCFGTQPKLLGLAINLLPHTDSDAINYYNSSVFQKRRLFVGNTTHKKNIFHLLPNQLLSIKQNLVKRFFPAQKLITNPIEHSAKNCALILKGFVEAISKRNKIKMAVTAGYDSRVLFLASLDVKCKYFVSRHYNMNDKHHDICIPQILTSIYDKNFTIEDDSEENTSVKNSDYINDVDFPRFLNFKDSINNYCFINGNVSEIARNYFGYHKSVTAKDLCFLSGNSDSRFAVKQYESWMKDMQELKSLGYNYLDMFYWEEKMGNWGAKSKTEAYALNKDIVSPFNSRELLVQLLSTKRKYRDSHYNHLYNLIIVELSNKRKEILKLPINPSKKQSIIKMMKSFKVYNIYRTIGLKTRKLKM